MLRGWQLTQGEVDLRPVAVDDRIELLVRALEVQGLSIQLDSLAVIELLLGLLRKLHLLVSLALR